MCLSDSRLASWGDAHQSHPPCNSTPGAVERQRFRLAALRECHSCMWRAACSPLPYEAAVWLLEEEEEMKGGHVPVGGQVGGAAQAATASLVSLRLPLLLLGSVVQAPARPPARLLTGPLLLPCCCWTPLQVVGSSCAVAGGVQEGAEGHLGSGQQVGGCRGPSAAGT